MDKLCSSFNTMIVCRAVENVAMTFGIVYSACYFERWTILWFLLLPVLHGLNLTNRSNDDNG